MALFALFLVGLSFLLPTPVARTQILLTLITAFLGRHEFLPALLILQIKRTDFFGGQSADLGTQIERFTEGAFRIGPFPINVGYALIIGALACVAYNLLTSPFLKKRIGWGSFIAFVASLAVAAVISVQSRLELIPTWTSPARLILAIAAFYYGAILYKKNTSDLKTTFGRIMILATTYTLYAGFRGRIASEMEYLYLATTAAFGVSLCLQRRVERKVLGVGIIAISLAPGLGISLTGGSGARTLTTVGTSSLAMILTYLTFLFSGSTRRVLPSFSEKTLAYGTTVVLLLAIVIPPMVLPKLTMGAKNEVGVYGHGEGIDMKDRVQYKVTYDRPCVWRGFWREVLTPPFIVKPIPTKVSFIFPDGREADWPYGAHNLFLSVLSTNRWFSGMHYMICFSYCLLSAAKASFSPRSALKVLSVPFVAFAGITSIGGGVILLSGPSILFFTTCGMCREQLRSDCSPRTMPAR